MQLDQIVNVASVPQRSPFRYPGGKTWLIPYIRQWLSPHTRRRFELTPTQPELLIEPFAGGGVVSLTATAEYLVQQAIMVELDRAVASVWQTIIHSDDWSWLTNQIITFDLTYENVLAHLAMPTPNTPTTPTSKEEAFRTIIRNRVNRGGILAPGAGLIKQGENNKGIRSRWYPKTLETRIRNIASIRDRITFIYGDGFTILQDYIHNPHAIFFLDPPYTAAGKKAGSRLYAHSEVDHEALFAIASQLKGDFLMTYNDADEIRDLASHYHFDWQLIPMKNTHHAKMTELLISPKLDWLRAR